MNIYIDRTIEFGQLLPPGAPDLQLDVGEHCYYLAVRGRPGESEAVRLHSATYCGVTDVLQFIAEVLSAQGSAPVAGDADEASDLLNVRDNARLRPVLLGELLLDALPALPRLNFDAERLSTSANAGQVHRNEVLARGLSWRRRADGQVEVGANPQAGSRVLTGWRGDLPSPHLAMGNAWGRVSEQSVAPGELTADARRAALALMQERQAALAEIDALQAMQPTLRAISRARNGHIEHASPETVRLAVERHRERANQEVSRLLQALRGDEA